MTRTRHGYLFSKILWTSKGWSMSLDLNWWNFPYFQSIQEKCCPEKVPCSGRSALPKNFSTSSSSLRSSFSSPASPSSPSPSSVKTRSVSLLTGTGRYLQLYPQALEPQPCFLNLSPPVQFPVFTGPELFSSFQKIVNIFWRGYLSFEQELWFINHHAITNSVVIFWH